MEHNDDWHRPPTGIFIKFGLDYRHYREGATLGQAEIFDPGHAAELAWRRPGSGPAGI